MIFSTYYKYLLVLAEHCWIVVNDVNWLRIHNQLFFNKFLNEWDLSVVIKIEILNTSDPRFDCIAILFCPCDSFQHMV